jgi:hypothetical protein
MRGCSCTPLHGQRSCRTLSSPMPVAAAIGTTMRGRHLHQSEWCPRHQVLRPRRLVAPGVEDQQQRARSGRLQQDPPRAIRDTTRVAAARCCGWQRSLPIGILHRQLLGIGVRPGVGPGPADRPDVVLGWGSWRCSGASPRSCWRSASATQERRPRPSILRAPADQTDLQGRRHHRGMSITTSSFSADARSRRPDHATTQRLDLATSEPRGLNNVPGNYS